MATISKDTPSLYLTTVAKDRLPIFRTDKIKAITCAAINEARKSGGFALYAYVIMPDHLHLITDAVRQPSDVLRFVKRRASDCFDHVGAKDGQAIFSDRR